MRKPGRFLALFLLLAPPALADETAKACAESFEKAQYLQRDSKLSAARAELTTCLRPTCPAFVKSECGKILQAIDEAQPTIIFSAQDDHGVDLAIVKVEQDGQPLLERLSGTVVSVDPGEHIYRFSAPDRSVVVQRVVARATEKNRIVQVTLPPVAPAITQEHGQRAEGRVQGRVQGPVWPSIVTGALGIGAIGGSIGLGIAGKTKADDLRQSCAPRCPHDDVRALNTQLVVSDVLLIGGVVLVGVAVWLFVARPGGREVKAQAALVF